MMTIDQILTKLDHYYKEDQLTEVEPFLLSCLEDAKKEQEYGIYISVGNELLGFYRSIGQFEAAFAVGEDVLLLMEELQLDHTVHFATTLFNVATAYRTAGKYEEALANYRRALEIYQKELPKDDYRLAELYSSISILLEKLNENENAALFLEKAIQIMEKQPGTRVEVATSRTSLALIELKMDKLEAAEKHLELAISAFKEDGGKTDTHYSAALAGLGEKTEAVRKLDQLKNYKLLNMRLVPHLNEIKRLNARLCIELGKYDDAKPLLDEMAAGNDDSNAAFAFLQKGNILRRKGNLKEASLMYLQATLLFPDSGERPEALYRLQAALTELKDPNAVRFANMLRKEYPDNPYTKRLATHKGNKK